jgi:hypothetical protein
LIRIVGLIIIAVLHTPTWAWACAVCGTSNEGAREAFVFTTIALTFLPLVGVFFGVYLLRRWLRAKRDLEADVPHPPA